MAVTLEQAKESPARKTEVGSYFISNYPPFSVWSGEGVSAAMEAFESPPKEPDARLGLYLHIPFCRKRCKFCYFRVYTDKNADEVEVYLSALSKEIDLYARRAGFGERQFEFVYFGGGDAFVFVQRAARAVDRADQSQLDVGGGEGGHVRVRAGNAQGVEAPDH